MKEESDKHTLYSARGISTVCVCVCRSLLPENKETAAVEGRWEEEEDEGGIRKEEKERGRVERRQEGRMQMPAVLLRPGVEEDRPQDSSNM